MDDRRLGRIARAIRQRLGLRQADVARVARVGQRSVSDLELGRVERLSLPTARAILAALDASLDLEIRWNRGDAHRLLDGAHAALVERVVRTLQAADWTVAVEDSFNHFGERGAVDVAAWHADSRTLLLVEVKSAIVDIQELLGVFARKVRIVPSVLAERRGWEASEVGRVLVVLGTTANRAAIARHRETFATALPDDSQTFLRWIRRPTGRVAAIWFIAPTTVRGGRHIQGRRQRVRVARSAPREHIPIAPTTGSGK